MKIAVVNPSIYDYSCSTLIEGLEELGHEVLCSESSNYGISKSDGEFLKFAEHADIIAVSNNAGARHQLLYSIKSDRKVFIDGADLASFVVGSDVRYKAVFKRELCRAEQDLDSRRIHSFPFAAEKRYFPDQVKKDIIVSFVANMSTNPMRYSVHKRLVNMNRPGVVSGSTNERAYYPGRPQALPVNTPAYRSILARSLISINVPGGGYDCARCWEILAAGCMLFTYDNDIVIPNNFIDGVDCVTFSSLKEFEEKLVFYIDRPSVVREIAQRGMQKLLAHHTTVRRAEYFLEIAAKEIERNGYCESFFNPEMRALEKICSGTGIDICSGKPPVMPGSPTTNLSALLDGLANGDKTIPEAGTLDFVLLRHDCDDQSSLPTIFKALSKLLRGGGKIGVVWRETGHQLAPTGKNQLTPGNIHHFSKEVGDLTVQIVVPCVPRQSFFAILVKD